MLQSDRNAIGIPTLNDTLNQFESYTPPPPSLIGFADCMGALEIHTSTLVPHTKKLSFSLITT